MKHRDVGEHIQKHEAGFMTAYYWGQLKWAAEQRKRQTVWASDRPVPLGVIEADK